MRHLALLLLSFWLGGCATPGPAGPPSAASLFDDAAFQRRAIDERDVFALSPAMQAYLHSPAFTAKVKALGPERGLVDALYTKSELKLEYDTTRTRNAAETFAAHRGNCLSLVMMTAAFARALGLKVQYQNVMVEETWRRSGDLYLASNHVNLSLGKPHRPGVRSSDEDRVLTIDFLPADEMAGYRTSPLSEHDIVAMYLNNRAAEALVGERTDEAYWWTRAALQAQPRSVIAYNTLGVVYIRHGQPALAERALRAALVLEPEHVVVMQNLLPVLDSLGKRAEAQQLRQRLASIAPEPPFHFYHIGMAALQEADYPRAKSMFEREIRRAPYNDEFHFWLAMTFLHLGDTVEARQELMLARDASTQAEMREAYSAKLAELRTLTSPRQ